MSFGDFFANLEPAPGVGVGFVLGLALYGLFCLVRGAKNRIGRNLPPL